MEIELKESTLEELYQWLQSLTPEQRKARMVLPVLYDTRQGAYELHSITKLGIDDISHFHKAVLTDGQVVVFC